MDDGLAYNRQWKTRTPPWFGLHTHVVLEVGRTVCNGLAQEQTDVRFSCRHWNCISCSKCSFMFPFVLFRTISPKTHILTLAVCCVLGEAYMRLNKPDEAGHWYRESLRAKPDHIPAHLTYGKLLSSIVSPITDTHTHTLTQWVIR